MFNQCRQYVLRLVRLRQHICSSASVVHISHKHIITLTYPHPSLALVIEMPALSKQSLSKRNKPNGLSERMGSLGREL